MKRSPRKRQRGRGERAAAPPSTQRTEKRTPARTGERKQEPALDPQRGPAGTESPAAKAETATNAWDAHWHGSIAAVRPWLLERAVLPLVAFDIGATMIRGGARYGLGGFNVAHFSFLDRLIGVPTPVLYVGTLLLTAWLALFSALAAPVPRGVLAVIAAAYTLSWSMSQLDSYQHHYLLSWVLASLTLFPRLSAADLVKGSGAPRRKPALGYLLLSATLCTVYSFTALAKSEPEWLSGTAFQTLRGARRVLEVPLRELAAWGVPQEVSWRVFGTSVVFVQLVIAVGYAVAPWRDRSSARWLRWLTALGWVAAASFHVGAEILGLRIGWFSYYMLIIPLVYFAPAAWLLRLTTPLVRAAQGLLAARSFELGRWGAVAAGVVAALLLLGAGHALDLPGSFQVGGLLSVAAVALTLWAAPRAARLPVARWAGAAVVTTLVMWAVVAGASRAPYYETLARNLRSLSEPEAAALAQAKAREHGAPEPANKIDPPPARREHDASEPGDE